MNMMIVHVEGWTELQFVNGILANHLLSFGFVSVKARIVGNARSAGKRGGVRPWPGVRKEIINQLRSNSAYLHTTMVDFYGLPSGQNDGWPGRFSAGSQSHDLKAKTVEEAIAKDIMAYCGDLNPDRFIPNVVMHEFEALLFSDCSTFAQTLRKPDLESKFQTIRSSHHTPEDINDSYETSPSKRIIKLFPKYEKVTSGSQTIEAIGLANVRNECPHFDEWISKLEAAGG